MSERLKDKIAIVTGAGASGPGWGNGKAAAVLFAREGAKVLAADIDRAAAEVTAQIIVSEGGTCEGRGRRCRQLGRCRGDGAPVHRGVRTHRHPA